MRIRLFPSCVFTANCGLCPLIRGARLCIVCCCFVQDVGECVCNSCRESLVFGLCLVRRPALRSRTSFMWFVNNNWATCPVAFSVPAYMNPCFQSRFQSMNNRIVYGRWFHVTSSGLSRNMHADHDAVLKYAIIHSLVGQN